MSRTLTNNTGFNYAIQSAFGSHSPTSWRTLEPNDISRFGSEITKVARDPITNDRNRRKAIVTDLDSGVEFSGDWTGSHIDDFLEGFMYSSAVGAATFAPTAVTSTGYTVPSGGALDANTIIHATGFTTAANNGTKLVGASSTSTEIKASGLTAEASPPSNATVEVAGVRASTGDLQIDASGDLTSSTLDLSALGLSVGQVIHVGGVSAASQFANAANTGFARITAIASGKLTLDKKATTYVTDTGSGKTIEILFGRFVRNVATNHADYLERYFMFEAAYADLESGPADAYEYAKDNLCNEMTFNLPLTEKATLDFTFVGTDTDIPTTTRKTGASSAIAPLHVEGYGTSSDIARLRITKVDETGLTTDFKTMSLSINNNASMEKVIGTLGGKYANNGIFEVNVEATSLFTDIAVPTAIRNNETVTMDFSVKNSDGGVFVDIPSLVLEGGDKEFPRNESVTINIPGLAFKDETLGYSLGISWFPVLPS